MRGVDVFDRYDIVYPNTNGGADEWIFRPGRKTAPDSDNGRYWGSSRRFERYRRRFLRPPAIDFCHLLSPPRGGFLRPKRAFRTPDVKVITAGYRLASFFRRVRSPVLLAVRTPDASIRESVGKHPDRPPAMDLFAQLNSPATIEINERMGPLSRRPLRDWPYPALARKL